MAIQFPLSGTVLEPAWERAFSREALLNGRRLLFRVLFSNFAHGLWYWIFNQPLYILWGAMCAESYRFAGAILHGCLGVNYLERLPCAKEMEKNKVSRLICTFSKTNCWFVIRSAVLIYTKTIQRTPSLRGLKGFSGYCSCLLTFRKITNALYLLFVLLCMQI